LAVVAQQQQMVLAEMEVILYSVVLQPLAAVVVVAETLLLELLAVQVAEVVHMLAALQTLVLEHLVKEMLVGTVQQLQNVLAAAAVLVKQEVLVILNPLEKAAVELLPLLLGTQPTTVAEVEAAPIIPMLVKEQHMAVLAVAETVQGILLQIQLPVQQILVAVVAVLLVVHKIVVLAVLESLFCQYQLLVIQERLQVLLQ
jgi:hypothetical protein